MVDLKLQVSKRIKEIRLLAGLTQSELGDRIGVSEAEVSRYESGKANISLLTLRRVAEAFGVDLQIEFSDPHVKEQTKDRINKLGAIFGQLRKARNWKRNTLTELAGVPYGTYTKFERGIISLPVDSIKKLAVALEFDLDAYLAESDAAADSVAELTGPVEEPVSETEKLVYSAIRELRKESGLSADEVGERIGLAAASVYAIEAGRREMSLKNLYRYAQVLGFKLEFTLTKADS